MRSAVIMRVAPLAVLALFAVTAVPALSSPSVTRRAGVSLRRLSMTPGAVARHGTVRPLPLRVADPAAYRREKGLAEAGYQRWLRHHPTASGAAHAGARPTSVSGDLNHAGLAAADEGIPEDPPDTTGAVGPNDYVEMVNSEIAVYSKTDLSTPAYTMDEANFVGAPRDLPCDGNVEWDAEAGRWLYSAIGCDWPQDNGGALYFGWSNSSSPSLTPGNWCQYAIDTGNSLDDYPKIGHDDSQILIGVNEFALNRPDSHRHSGRRQGGEGIAAKIYVLDKPANGDTSCPNLATEESTAVALTVGPFHGGAWTPVPANLADSSAVGYVAAIDIDQRHLHLYTIGRDSNQANVILHSQTLKVPSFCVPAGAPQKGTKNRISTLDSRLTQAVAVTDPSTGKEGIWTQHTVSSRCVFHHFPVGPSVVRWYELTPGASAPTQIGTVHGANGAFAFMGAISPSADGQNAAIFYNESSKKTLPEFHVRDRHLSTTRGRMIEDLLLATSTNSDEDRSCNRYYRGRPCRWGDYTGASPDPSDPSLIWGSGEITAAPPGADGLYQWGTENAAIDVTPAATATFAPRKRQ